MDSGSGAVAERADNIDLDICVVIGRPRSGTTVFEAMLDSHPQIFCMGEILNEQNEETYFNFLKKVAARDPGIVLPSRSIPAFKENLSHCAVYARSVKPTCKVLILNVKYEQTHLVTEAFWQVSELPRLFRLIYVSQWRVIDIRRKDILALIVSNCVAIETNIYHSTDLQPGQLQRATVRIGRDLLEGELRRTSLAYRRVGQFFSDYSRYRRIPYEDMFEPDEPHSFRAELLQNISAFLGVENRFDPVPRLQKILNDDVFSYVENASEVRSIYRNWERQSSFLRRFRDLFRRARTD